MNKIYIIDETKSTQIIVDGQSVTYYLTPGIPERNTASDEPNYTDAQYHTAYANGLIIAAEIIKAYNEGYRYVKLKKGAYSLCPVHTGATRGERPSIFLEGLHGIDIDLGESTLRIINDSDFSNPHYLHNATSTYNKYVIIMSLYNCTDVHIHSGKMIGDVEDRSWSDSRERRSQSSNGLMIEDRCANIEVSKIEFSMWMDNAISNGNVFHNGCVRYNVTGWQRGKTIDSSGEVVDQAEGARPHYVSEMIEFDQPYYDLWRHDFGQTMRQYNRESCIKGYENFLCFRAMGNNVGFLYMPYMDYPGFTVYYYRRDENDDLVYSNEDYMSMSMLSNNFGYINIGEGDEGEQARGYDAMRILITDEETDLSEVDDLTRYFMLMIQAVPNFGLKVHDCLIKDTHKGGFANFPAYSIIENNTFINCSKDCGLSRVPPYNESTRYCIDLEDLFYTNIVIRNNRFDSCATAMILGCDNTEVYGNLIVACESGISIRFGSNFSIHDNKITGTGGVFDVFGNEGTWRGGGKHVTNISIHGNYFEGGSFKSRSSNQERRYTNYRDNLFIVKDILLDAGNTDNIFSDCKFILKPGGSALQLKNSTFKNCILESSEKRDAYIVNIKGSLHMKNIVYNMSQETGNTIDGIHFGSGSELSVSFSSDYGDTLVIKNCIFDDTINVFDRNYHKYKTHVTDSVFLGSPACSAAVWPASFTGHMEFTAYNCKFYCSYDNLFVKNSTPSRSITYSLANCLFNYPK